MLHIKYVVLCVRMLEVRGVGACVTQIMINRVGKFFDIVYARYLGG